MIKDLQLLVVLPKISRIMNRKYLLCTLIVVVAVISVYAQKNKLNLSEAEMKFLTNGEVLVNVLDKCDDLAFLPGDDDFSVYMNEIRQLKPTYLCECIKVFPYSGGENILEVIDEAMLDIPSYVRIPYYSQYNDVYTVLFLESQQLDYIKRGADGSDISLDARFYMPPFDRFNINLQRTISSEKALYKAYNTTNVTYRWFFRAVSKKNMKISLFVFHDDENWYFYSIGAARTIKFPIAGARIRMAVINRLKDFASYFVSLV